MKLVSAKCINCCANIEIDETKHVGTCPYCRSVFIVEKIKPDETEKSQSYAQNTTQNSKNIYNQNSKNIYNQNTKDVYNYKIVPPRPKIRPFIAFVLLCCYFFPGIIYIAGKRYLQSEWDKKYIYDT